MNPVIPENARRSLALELSRHYGELAGNEPPNAPRFLFGRAIQGMLTERGLVDGYEAEICASAATIAGQRHDPHKVVFPFSAFRRDLTVSAAGLGGYLVASEKQRPVDVMRSWSVTFAAGITALTGVVGTPSIPRVISAAAASWAPTESSAITQSEPSLGEAVATPKAATGYLRFSRQLLTQAETFDRFIETQLLEAAGALVDQAVLGGTGSAGQPMGVINTSGVGSQAGASLSHNGTKAMRLQILNAGGREDALSWVGATDAQDTLGGRERFAGGGRAIWDDSNILGRPAFATKYAPAGTLIAGDWSRAILCVWGPGFQVEIDPYTYFTTAKIAARIIVECDVIFAPAAAFSVATSVT